MNTGPITAFFLTGTILFSLLTTNGLGSPPQHRMAAADSLIHSAQASGQKKADSKIEADSKILVELFLMRDRKGELDKIKKELQAASITRIRTYFYPAGKPVQILAVGRHTPAPLARLGIRLALTYNEGIKYLLPQILIPHHYLAIGTSAFDENNQIGISPEDLKRLSDPSLSTTQFHTLYGELTGDEHRP